MSAAAAGVERFRRRLDPSSRYGMPAHVTVLFPFVSPAEITDDVEEELRTVFAGHPSFDFALSDVRWFDDRVVYLAPTPAEPFRQLTMSVWDRFPACLPYEGAYPDVVPHVCIGEDAPGILMRGAGWLVGRRLPLQGRVTEVWLMTVGDPEPTYRLRTAFPLGGRVG